MTMSRYKDFDAAIAGLEPIVVKLAGKEWEFPPEIPAPVVHTMLRRGLDEDGNANTQDAIELWEQLIGKQRLQDLYDAGATWSQVEALSVYLMQEYGISNPEDEVATEEGDAGPPA